MPPTCGIAGCGEEAIGSTQVVATVWFASDSNFSQADNGDAPGRWELGGHVEPMTIVAAMHVCARHQVEVDSEVS